MALNSVLKYPVVLQFRQKCTLVVLYATTDDLLRQYDSAVVGYVRRSLVYVL
jgi:hypothetical protein